MANYPVLVFKNSITDKDSFQIDLKDKYSTMINQVRPRVNVVRLLVII